MKFLLLSIGTRGDMEPFLAIAELLREKGHQVVCGFPEQFGELAEVSGIPFASLGRKYIDLLESPDGKAALGGSGKGFRKFFAYIRLAARQTDANKELVHKQYELIRNEKPDRIIYNGKALIALLWELEHPGHTIFISQLPYMHYVKGHTHIVFNSNLGTFLNKLSFSLAGFGMVTTTMISKRWLNLPGKTNRKALFRILKEGRSVYTISPVLFARPVEWPKNLQVLGHHQPKLKQTWKPSPELSAFIEKHEKILFVTFGSMSNPEPELKTRTLLEILERNQIPAIINTAAGGLIKPAEYSRELLCFVSQIPYEWIFPKVYAVIHHGGSGTTHQALKHGCATMIIPHIIDQFVWNQIVSELGAGPKGVNIGKLSAGKLEPLLLDLYKNRDYKERAEQLGKQMRSEDLKDELYRYLI